MGLSPIAFDIETSGLDDAVITVAGFAHEIGESIILNTRGRDPPIRLIVIGTTSLPVILKRYNS